MCSFNRGLKANVETQCVIITAGNNVNWVV